MVGVKRVYKLCTRVDATQRGQTKRERTRLLLNLLPSMTEPPAAAAAAQVASPPAEDIILQPLSKEPETIPPAEEEPTEPDDVQRRLHFSSFVLISVFRFELLVHSS